MPRSEEIQKQYARHIRLEFENAITALLKERGFTSTLKTLNKGQKISSVTGGVLEEGPTGLYDAALDTDYGPIVLRNAQRANQFNDPQLICTRRIQAVSSVEESDGLDADRLLAEFVTARKDVPPNTIHRIEVASFDLSGREKLTPLLWQYILDHRDSNDRIKLAAVGAAIRKYIAIMPMEHMDSLTVLLESGHRTPLSMELEVEVVKMIYRNFEVHPPNVMDSHKELAKQLWQMIEAYTDPRILLRDKYAAIASLAIEAVIAMRSTLSEKALQAALTSPFGWFAELVSDDLSELHTKWVPKNPEAAAWLQALCDRTCVHA